MVSLGDIVKVKDGFLSHEISGKVVEIYDNGEFKIDSGDPYMDSINHKVDIV